MTVPDEQARIRSRVFALVEALDLRGQGKPLELSEIDAAFYLLIVKRDLVDRIFAIKPERDQSDVIRMLISDHFSSDDIASTLRELQSQIDVAKTQIEVAHVLGESPPEAFTLHFDDECLGHYAYRALSLFRGSINHETEEDWAELQQEIPNLHMWATFGSMPSLWNPWVRIGSLITEGYLTICVPNAEIRGKRLIEFLEGGIQIGNEYRPNLPQTHRSDLLTTTFYQMRIESWFRDVGYDDLGSAGPPFAFSNIRKKTGFGFPFVELRIFPPFPTPGMVASYYDKMVVDTLGWHMRLRGRRNGQSNEVAIRTWAVGILTKEGGMKRVPAYQKVARILGSDPGNDKRFTDDAQAIVDRVQIPGLEEIIMGKNTWNPDRMR